MIVDADTLHPYPFGVIRPIRGAFGADSGCCGPTAQVYRLQRLYRETFKDWFLSPGTHFILMHVGWCGALITPCTRRQIATRLIVLLRMMVMMLMMIMMM